MKSSEPTTKADGDCQPKSLNKNFLANLLREEKVASSSSSNLLPAVDGPAFVEPNLAHCAHRVWQDPVTQACLYVGPQNAAAARESLEQAGIAAIVNCTPRFPCHFSDMAYCQVAIHDEAGADILNYIHSATLFVHTFLSKGSSVLVHCERGVSRSATIAIAYLMRYHHPNIMSLEAAYTHVKSRRPPVQPNPGFWRQLVLYEKLLVKQQGDTQSEKEEDSAQPPIDDKWVKESTATYAALRHIESLQEEISEHCFGRRLQQSLNSGDKNGAVDHVLNVSLDFIWGRGVLPVEVDWLVKICAVLDAQQVVPCATERVKSMLLDPDSSQFGQDWAGEIYDKDVEKVLTALGVCQ